MEPLAVGMHAVRRGRLKPGEPIVILGAGTIGLVTILSAKAAGAGEIIVADLEDVRLEMAKKLGADEIIDSKEVDLTKEVLRLTEGKGVDAVLDFVASPQTLEAGFESLGRAGRLVILGFRPPHVFNVDPIFRVNPLVVLNKGLEIHGYRYVSMAELIEAVKVVKEGRIKPVVTQTFALEEAEKVHQLVMENKITGRAALVI